MSILSGVLSKGRSSLGRCTVCIRKAFMVAVAAWSLMLGLWLLPAAVLWQGLALALAIGVTLLWVSHLIAYSVKALSQPPCGKQAVRATGSTRREVVVRFANAFAFIATSTAIPAFANACVECTDEVMEGNRGWGPCGNPCRLADGRQIPCKSCERPVMLPNGDCVCCGFRVCD